MNHILVVDRFYMDALEGGTLGPAARSDEEPCKTLTALRATEFAELGWMEEQVWHGA